MFRIYTWNLKMHHRNMGCYSTFDFVIVVKSVGETRRKVIK